MPLTNSVFIFSWLPHIELLHSGKLYISFLFYEYILSLSFTIHRFNNLHVSKLYYDCSCCWWWAIKNFFYFFCSKNLIFLYFIIHLKNICFRRFIIFLLLNRRLYPINRRFFIVNRRLFFSNRRLLVINQRLIDCNS